MESTENTDYRAVEDVKIFAGDDFHEAADAQYKNLVWSRLRGKTEASAFLLSFTFIQIYSMSAT